MIGLRPKLTYSNVVSTICLFLLLGGGAAYAASHLGKNSVGPKQLRKNAVTGPKVKDHSLTGRDIDASTLGTVPRAADADHATTVDAFSHPVTVHLVGGSGEPQFENGAANYSPSFTPAGFYKDHDCVVHLQGTVGNSNNNAVAFTLPVADRPEKAVLAPITGNPPETGTAHVDPEGTVRLTVSVPQGIYGIDGVSFRAATC